MDPLIAKPAREVVALLKSGQVTPDQLIDAAEARIEAVDTKLNALPTLCTGRARDAARNLTPTGRDGAGARGWLAGQIASGRYDAQAIAAQMSGRGLVALDNVALAARFEAETPKVETHRYPARDDRHFRRLFAVIRAYLDDLHSNRFVFRPGWMCSMCEFRDTRCSAWQG